MKKAIDIILWSTTSFLLIPSGLILISWNALPGQQMYRVKVGLEKTLLAVLPSSVLQSSMQVRFTERRFDEAEQLLATNLATTGLNNLDQQVLETQRSIQYLDNPADQAKAADQYIQTLRKVSTKLAQRQQTMTPQQLAQQQYAAGQTPEQQFQQDQTGGTTTVINNYYYYPTPVPQQTAQGTSTSPSQTGSKSPGKTSQPAAASAPTQAPTATAQPSTSPESDLSSQINNTQQQIEDTIREMERIKHQAEEDEKKKGKNDKKQENDQGQENQSGNSNNQGKKSNNVNN
ncbi:MAG TPA: hypothetical protein VJ246_03245 [Patescibacteria group bacterium]|nr:hypothetical protein [Patescibacteria group bacterium]